MPRSLQNYPKCDLSRDGSPLLPRVLQFMAVSMGCDASYINHPPTREGEESFEIIQLGQRETRGEEFARGFSEFLAVYLDGRSGRVIEREMRLLSSRYRCIDSRRWSISPPLALPFSVFQRIDRPSGNAARLSIGKGNQLPELTALSGRKRNFMEIQSIGENKINLVTYEL